MVPNGGDGLFGQGFGDTWSQEHCDALDKAMDAKQLSPEVIRVMLPSIEEQLARCRENQSRNNPGLFGTTPADYKKLGDKTEAIVKKMRAAAEGK